MSVIEKALSTSKTLDLNPEIEEELNQEYARLSELSSRLLPFESKAKGDLQERMELLRKSIKLGETAKAVGNLPMLDPIVFTWTKSQSIAPSSFWKTGRTIEVPSLAFIPSGKAGLELSVDSRGDTWIDGEWHSNRHYPPSVERAYRGTLAAMKGEVRPHRRLRLSYSYPGVVPEEIRDIIDAEHERLYDRRRLHRFDSLAFICEVGSWEIDEKPEPPVFLDPILVGVKDGSCFVLASFDPTTLENYISSEFTS